MIEAQKVDQEIRGKGCVDDVTFRCEPGTVTASSVPNGAGKTTTMCMICGFSTPGLRPVTLVV
jgi:ABC-2 type transport system ATP-binding protein